MSIEGQGHFFTIYFPGFVCFVLYLAKISGERLQDHWSSGLIILSTCAVHDNVLSIWTPRSFSLVDMFIVSSESFRSGRFSSILLAAVREARNMALVLGTLTTILFLIHQSWKFFKSSFRQFVRFRIDGSELDSVASLANKI